MATISSFFSFARPFAGKRKADNEMGGDTSRQRTESDSVDGEDEDNQFEQEIEVSASQQMSDELEMAADETQEGHVPMNDDDNATSELELPNEYSEDVRRGSYTAVAILYQEAGGRKGSFVDAELNSSMQRPERSAQHNEEMRSGTGRAHLLNLPQPIRARILVLALVRKKADFFPTKGHAVATTSAHPKTSLIPVRVSIEAGDPAAHVSLLRVCHQIRAEAIPIFYTGNRFELEVRNFDGASLLPWWTKAQDIWADVANMPIRVSDGTNTTSLLVHVGMELIVHYEPNWENLQEWMRLAHAGEMTWPEGNCSGGDGRLVGVAAGFESVIALEEFVPWNVTKKMLGGVRSALARDSKDWRIVAINEEEGDGEVEEVVWWHSEEVDSHHAHGSSAQDVMEHDHTTTTPPSKAEESADVPNEKGGQKDYVQEGSDMGDDAQEDVSGRSTIRPQRYISHPPRSAMTSGFSDIFTTPRTSTSKTFGRPTQPDATIDLTQAPDDSSSSGEELPSIADILKKRQPALKPQLKRSRADARTPRLYRSYDEFEQDTSRDTDVLPPSAQKDSRPVPKFDTSTFVSKHSTAAAASAPSKEDIPNVMEFTGCPREEATKALKANNNEVEAAIDFLLAKKKIAEDTIDDSEDDLYD